MRMAKIGVLIATLVMAATLIFGFSQGNFTEEGNILLSMPWGIVSLVDVYVMFSLFSLWVIFRERSLWRSILWIVLIMTLGSVVAGVYTLIALQNSQGDWKRVWYGRRML